MNASSEVVTTKEMAEILGVSVDTLRALGSGPRAIVRPIRRGLKRWLWHVPSVRRAFEEASVPPTRRKDLK